MRAIIGSTLLSSRASQPREKPFEIYDSRLPDFTLRVQPSGVQSYYARFGRNRRVVLGNSEAISPEEARERCQKVLGNVAHGLHPLHGLRGTDGMTLGMFIADGYTAWVKASRPRTAANTLEKLCRHFRTWYPEPLTAITVERIEAWKWRRLNAGRSASTVFRDLFALSSVLRHAVNTGELTENPVRRVAKPWSSQDSVDTSLCVLRTGFERFWTDASQVAMASDRIVERIDVVGHILSRQLSVLVDPLLDPLFLQARKE